MANANAIRLDDLAPAAAWRTADARTRRAFLGFARARASDRLKGQVGRGIGRDGKKLRRVRPASRPDGATGPPLDPHREKSRTIKWLRSSPAATRRGITLWWSHGWGKILGYHGDGLVKGAPVRDVRGLAPKEESALRSECAAWWQARSPGPVAAPKAAQAPLSKAKAKAPTQQELLRKYPYLGAYLDPPPPGVSATKPGPAAAPKPKPKPKPAPPAWPTDPRAGVEVVKKLGGSTGAELVKDRATGALFVRKRGNSPEHVREEAAADAAYQALGVPVPEFRLYETPGGPVKLARHIEGTELGKLTGEARRAAEARLREHFATDALLGNWDVVGMGVDNVLVDRHGVPWRIDNGGALRFRAQGAMKTADQWDAYPSELWSLRDPTVNAQTAGVFGPLGASDLARQVRAIEAKAAGLKLPESVRGTVTARLGQLRDAADRIETLTRDHFKDDYADAFARHTIGIRKAGIVARMPTALTRPSPTAVEVRDQDGKPWDHLRGAGSLVADLERYMKAHGGNYNACRFWMGDQAGSSWSPLPQALKSFLAKNRTRDANDYWWKVPPAGCAQRLGEAAAKAGGEGTYAESFTALHAFTHEYLAKAAFDGKDAARGTVRLMRTEDRAVMRRHNLEPGDRDVKMKRGVLESTSIYRRVAVHGSELTVQDVPIHRIIATYWQERRPGSDSAAFLGDHENEFLAILDDLPFEYRR